MFIRRVPHAAPPGYAARIREELKPLIGIYPAGYGLVGTDGAPLTVGSGVAVAHVRDGTVLDTSTGNTGLTRAYAVTDHPLTLVFGARWDSSSGAPMIASLATSADKTVRVYNAAGAIEGQHIGATTNAAINTGVIVSDGYFVNGVVVFASPTDMRVYGSGNAGRGRGASTTNVGALGALTKAAFGVYDGSVVTLPMDGQIQYAQWLRVALTEAEAWALVDNPWGMFEPRRIWVPVSAGGAVTHTATGALVAGAAVVAGTATDVATYTATGALSAAAAVVAGTATHLTLHTSTGALVAGAAVVVGAANHINVHGSTGALVAGAAVVAGAAEHTAPGSFTSTGALTASAAVVAGTATHLTLHTSTGVLAAGAATVAGVAVHPSSHAATGSLQAAPATVAGAALHTGPGADVEATIVGGGGWAWAAPRKASRYDRLSKPTREQMAERVRKQREALGILPKPVRKRVEIAATKEAHRAQPSLAPLAPLAVEIAQDTGIALQAVADAIRAVFDNQRGLIEARRQADDAARIEAQQQADDQARMAAEAAAQDWQRRLPGLIAADDELLKQDDEARQQAIKTIRQAQKALLALIGR